MTGLTPDKRPVGASQNESPAWFAWSRASAFVLSDDSCTEYLGGSLRYIAIHRVFTAACDHDLGIIIRTDSGEAVGKGDSPVLEPIRRA
jgi:hypothetical protein